MANSILSRLKRATQTQGIREAITRQPKERNIISRPHTYRGKIHARYKSEERRSRSCERGAQEKVEGTMAEGRRESTRNTHTTRAPPPYTSTPPTYPRQPSSSRLAEPDVGFTQDTKRGRGDVGSMLGNNNAQDASRHALHAEATRSPWHNSLRLTGRHIASHIGKMVKRFSGFETRNGDDT